jgi:thioredoxin
MKGFEIMAEGIMEIEDNSFETEVLQSDKPVLVDFWAPWCGPCKAIGPVVEELSETFGDKVKFAKCNVDNNPVTPGKIRHQGHSHPHFFQGWRRGRADNRDGGQVKARRRPQQHGVTPDHGLAAIRMQIYSAVNVYTHRRSFSTLI